MNDRREIQHGTPLVAQLDVAFRDFVGLLHRRFAAGVYTTEDSARYTFFAALLESGVAPEEIVLEYAHPTIPGARVDAVILDGKRPCIAFEFKYDRAIPSGRSLPLAQKDGAVFADMVRLLAWPGALDRYVVYLSDKPPGASSALATIFSLALGRSQRFDTNAFLARPATFHSAMGVWPVPAVLTVILSDTLPQTHHLRVYRIEPEDD